MTMEVSPLSLAISCVGFDSGDEEKIMILINAGADIEAHPKTISCGSPLYQAAVWGSIPAVCMLLHKGAEINSKSHEENMTPLMAAAKAGHGGVVRILLAAGADTLILGGLGNDVTALDLVGCGSGTCQHLLHQASLPA